MIVRSRDPAALRAAHATIKIVSDTAEILAESACALGEMFLIKRPFSCATRLEGAYNHGKTNQKEEFCKEIGCA
jgi:hypothetical protein